MKMNVWLAAAAAGFFSIATPAPAQDTGSVADAFSVARTEVKPELQTKVVSVYGTGTATAIDKWYIIFYDPTVASHGRAVLVEGKKFVKTYPAAVSVTYSKDLTFDPSRITSEGPALTAARTYAAKRKITFDSVHALLKQALNKPFRWRIELLNAGKSRGYVYVNALDASVADFVDAEPAPRHRKSHHAHSGADDFADDVRDTFLGIGGDLEEFFTGERTVDR